jgi:hypothetical protein
MYFKGGLALKNNVQVQGDEELSDSEVGSDQEDDYLKLKT